MNRYTIALNGDRSGGLPAGWVLNDFGNCRAPKFVVKNDEGGAYLSVCGGGDHAGNAYISTRLNLDPGTYRYRALFSLSEDVNPQRNLLFQCRASSFDGIFKFYRLEGGMVEGRDTVFVSGDKPHETELRIYYRFNSGGEVKIRELSLSPCEAVKPRWARFACTSGRMNRKQMVSIASRAKGEGTDLLLYPEYVSQEDKTAAEGELILGLLSGLAEKYGIYTAASVQVTDKIDGRKYNRGVLYDRRGSLIGIYDKIHPYSPEITEDNISPGTRTGIFTTDFGKVGMIICYDSWFTDATQFLALKGAEVILFPVAGYYRSLIPARSADNQVRFVISVLNDSDGYGIFDAAGRDIEAPEKDLSVRTVGTSFKDIKTFNVEGIGLLCASLDLNCSFSPHYNGGRMHEAPGGKRNRDDQLLYLDDLIKKEKERWWEIE
ncbi:MAG: carbon-nitrogen hydrolase family protein [Spirochaetaceae bacterium]|nr:carbon-nitrogen hydrolase family protein [Spirochaetaceae bacterium]